MPMRFFLIALMVLWCNTLVTLVGEPVGASDDLAELSPQQTAAFEWFDTLGYPSFQDLQLIRIESSWDILVDGEQWPKSYSLAFLIDEDKPSFSAIGFDLDITKHEPNMGPFARKVSFECIDFLSAATEYLQTTRTAFEETRDKNRSRLPGELQFGPHLQLEERLFVLSRACAEKGHIELSTQLYELGEQIWRNESDRRRNYPKKPKNYQEALYHGIAHKEMWQAVINFGEPKVSRPELLTQLNRISEHFLKSEHANLALDMAERLELMIDEDLEHEKNIKPFGEMNRQEQIANLIFRLRDQNGHQWSQPGWCDVFADGNESNPAAQLVEIGFDAIPHLIDNLANDRYSRSVGFHRDFYFSHRVLTVGECAQAILEKIASRSFRDSRIDTETQIFERNALAWWDEVKEKGEERVLIEAVEKADRNSPAQADRLAKRYPQSALAAMIRATEITDDIWILERLIPILGTLEEESAVLFLRNQMREARYLCVRVAAAEALFAKDRNESLKALLSEWNSLSKESPDRHGLTDLIELLAKSDSPEIIQSLSAHLSLHSIETKIYLIQQFVSNIDPTTIEPSPLIDGEHPNTKAPLAVEKEIERLLVLALEDTEQRMGMSGGWRNRSYHDPRVCDMAAHALWSRWPAKYDFDISVPKFARDRQLLQLKNVIRKEQGLTLLENQELPSVPHMSVDELRPLWTKLINTDGPTMRDAIAKELESHGLSILPAGTTLLAELNDQHHNRKVAEELLCRISMTVRKVNILEDHFAEQDQLITRLKRLEGKHLTAERFVETVLDFQTNLPPNIDSFKISIERDANNSGALVTLETKEEVLSGVTTAWNYTQLIHSGREHILSSSGMGINSYFADRDAHADLLEKYHEASKKLEMPFEVTVQFSRINE